MHVFWNHDGDGPDAADAEDNPPVDLAEALRIWRDELPGVEDDFFGLVDSAGHTVQFYFNETPATDPEAPLEERQTIQFDLPVQALGGSYVRMVDRDTAEELIEFAFASGGDPVDFESKFGVFDFLPWGEGDEDGEDEDD